MPKLSIIAKKDGFRRAGMSFSDREPTVVDTKDLTPEQVEALRSEKMLVVVDYDPAAAKAAAKDLDKLGEDLKALKELNSALEAEVKELKAQLEAATKPASKK